MPDFKLGFLSDKYLAAVELERPVTVTIESIKLERISDESDAEECWVLRAKGGKKGVVLNLTNCQLLAGLFRSRNTDDWLGKRVTLRSEKVRFGPDTVDGIRVCGSPDLKAPLKVQVQLPRRKPVAVTLQPTGSQAREPGEEG